MNYNDFSILSDNEYLKLANEYKSIGQINQTNTINHVAKLLSIAKNHLILSNEFKNNKIKNELKTHIQTIDKLINNLSLTYQIEKINYVEINNFNIFNYLSILSSININLNSLIHNEKKEYIKNILKKIYTEINQLNISLLNILAQLNIYFFQFM